MFKTQYRKKAFYSQYIERGMEDKEFVFAESSLNDFLEEYMMYTPDDRET